MNWIKQGTRHPDDYISHIGDISYKVILFRKNIVGVDCWCSIFFSDYNSTKIGLYITKSIKTDLHTNTGIQEEHKFATKEEAMAVCERHYRLLILQ
jgi:hypothetical protein